MTALAPTFFMFEMNDNQDALTLEGVYKKYGTFGGVMEYEFTDDITGFKSAKWDAMANVSYTSDKIARSGTVGADGIVWYSDSMPHSYTFEYFMHNNEGGFVIRGDGGTNYYKFLYNVSGYAVLYKSVSGVVGPIVSKELQGTEVVSYGKVTVSVRDAQYTADSGGRIIYISVWINDQLILSGSDNVADSIPPLRFGMVIPAGAATDLYSGLRVPNLGEVIVWSSLDPGENPQGAISRAIEDRYIKQWIRWNGALKVWKPAARTVAAQIPMSKEFNLINTLDTKQIFSHVRMLGAFQWVQVSDPDLERRFGHKFREVNNTSLWNADDCYRVALQLLLRSKEAANQAQFDTFGYMFLELEDRMQLPDRVTPGDYIDYIIDSISWSAKNDTFSTSMSLRRYYYGEP